MDSISKLLQAYLLWQFISFINPQYMPQMPPMPFPPMGMGPMGPQMGPQMGPMGPMGPGQQMQMAPIPPMQMGPMPMPMPIGLANPKLPVVVMPYHSKSADKKGRSKRKSHRRKKKHRSSDESCSSDTDDSGSYDDDTRRSNSYRRSSRGSSSDKRKEEKRRHQVLTPVISYVTKDGYVVYQKKIKKERAKDWLDLGKKEPEDQRNLVEDTETSDDSAVSEETMKEIKQRYKKAQKKRRKNN